MWRLLCQLVVQLGWRLFSNHAWSFRYFFSDFLIFFFLLNFLSYYELAGRMWFIARLLSLLSYLPEICVLFFFLCT